MKFKLNDKQMGLLSSNIKITDKRWKLVGLNEFGKYMDNSDPRKEEMLRNLNSTINVDYERTIISLAYDSLVKRPVMVKTIRYDAKDLLNEETVIAKRKVLEEQINILNNLSSPLLPEPLDWLTVENTDDGIPESLAKSEPLLVLDYIPGYILSSYIKDKKFFYKKDGGWNIEKVTRLIQRIVIFLKMLDENNYGYVGLNAEHIILLNDEIPRFVGLGRICEMKDGYLVNDHINFDRTVRGYSAPELNHYDETGKVTEKITGRQVGAFSIGVLLHQIFLCTSYIDNKTVKDGAFIYPNGITEEKILDVGWNWRQGQIIHDLISRLCEHDVKKRLCDYDEILKILKSLEKRTINDIRENVRGKIKTYYSSYESGYLIAEDNEQYKYTKLSLKYLSEEERSLIRRGQSVIFEINNATNIDGTTAVYINKLRILDEEDARDLSIKIPYNNYKTNNYKTNNSDTNKYNTYNSDANNSSMNDNAAGDIRSRFSKLFDNR